MRIWIFGAIVSLTASSAAIANGECSQPLVHVHAKKLDNAYALDGDRKLMLFYKAPLQSEGFQALLNGEDISDRFTPAAGKFGEVLSLELREGENVLALSGVINSLDGDCNQPVQQEIRLRSHTHNEQLVSTLH